MNSNFSVFQTKKNSPQQPNINQTLIGGNNLSPNSSFMRQQRMSPINLNNSGPENPIYGDPHMTSPYQRYHKRTL